MRRERRKRTMGQVCARIYRGFMNLHSGSSRTQSESVNVYTFKWKLPPSYFTLIPPHSMPLRELPLSRICFISALKSKSSAMNLYYIARETRIISDRRGVNQPK